MDSEISGRGPRRRLNLRKQVRGLVRSSMSHIQEAVHRKSVWPILGIRRGRSRDRRFRRGDAVADIDAGDLDDRDLFEPYSSQRASDRYAQVAGRGDEFGARLPVCLASSSNERLQLATRDERLYEENIEFVNRIERQQTVREHEDDEAKCITNDIDQSDRLRDDKTERRKAGKIKRFGARLGRFFSGWFSKFRFKRSESGTRKKRRIWHQPIGDMSADENQWPNSTMDEMILMGTRELVPIVEQTSHSHTTHIHQTSDSSIHESIFSRGTSLREHVRNSCSMSGSGQGSMSTSIGSSGNSETSTEQSRAGSSKLALRIPRPTYSRPMRGEQPPVYQETSEANSIMRVDESNRLEDEFTNRMYPRHQQYHYHGHNDDYRYVQHPKSKLPRSQVINFSQIANEDYERFQSESQENRYSGHAATMAEDWSDEYIDSSEAEEIDEDYTISSMSSSEDIANQDSREPVGKRMLARPFNQTKQLQGSVPVINPSRVYEDISNYQNLRQNRQKFDMEQGTRFTVVSSPSNQQSKYQDHWNQENGYIQKAQMNRGVYKSNTYNVALCDQAQADRKTSLDFVPEYQNDFNIDEMSSEQQSQRVHHSRSISSQLSRHSNGTHRRSLQLNLNSMKCEQNGMHQAQFQAYERHSDETKENPMTEVSGASNQFASTNSCQFMIGDGQVRVFRQGTNISNGGNQCHSEHEELNRRQASDNRRTRNSMTRASFYESNGLDTDGLSKNPIALEAKARKIQSNNINNQLQPSNESSERNSIIPKSKPPILMLNNQEINEALNYKLYTNQLFLERIILQASTSELIQCLSDFLKIRCSLVRQFSPRAAIKWLEVIDRVLLAQGWQEVTFINPANLVFLYMLFREVIHPNKYTHITKLQYSIMTALYLAYSYVGNEISYPLLPFLCQFDSHRKFWSRSLRMIRKSSSSMLRINLEPTYFAEVFFELKRYQYIASQLEDGLTRPRKLRHLNSYSYRCTNGRPRSGEQAMLDSPIACNGTGISSRSSSSSIRNRYRMNSVTSNNNNNKPKFHNIKRNSCNHRRKQSLPHSSDVFRDIEQPASRLAINKQHKYLMRSNELDQRNHSIS